MLHLFSTIKRVLPVSLALDLVLVLFVFYRTNLWMDAIETLKTFLVIFILGFTFYIGKPYR